MPNYNANANGIDTRFQAQGNPDEPLADKPNNTKHYRRVREVLQRMDAQGTIHLDMWPGKQPVALPPPHGITLAEGDWGRIAPPF